MYICVKHPVSVLRGFSNQNFWKKVPVVRLREVSVWHTNEHAGCGRSWRTFLERFWLTWFSPLCTSSILALCQSCFCACCAYKSISPQNHARFFRAVLFPDSPTFAPAWPSQPSVVASSDSIYKDVEGGDSEQESNLTPPAHGKLNAEGIWTGIQISISFIFCVWN